MLATLKVTGVNKVENEADNLVSINVSFNVVGQDEVLGSDELSFPATHTKDQIQAELKSYLNEFNAQREATVNNEVEAAIDQVINEVSGLEVVAEDPPVDGFIPEPATPQTDAVVEDNTEEAIASESQETNPEPPTTAAPQVEQTQSADSEATTTQQ